MPTETKKSTANASCSGSASVGRLVAQVRLVDHHAGEERAERERHAEELGRRRTRCRATSASTASVNSSREPVRATRARSHGMTRAPDDQHERDEQRDLAQREAERDPERAPARPRPSGAVSAQRLGEGRQQHEHQHDREILDDQPADGDAAVVRRRAGRAPRARAAARRCSRPRAPGRTRGPRRATSPTAIATPTPSAVATAICATAPGIAIGAHRQQVARARSAGRRRTSAG